ncbi:hypothetical protein FH972_008083 [Carpinus fangiana]|uniref:Uncharacterized protein n=1 Tax=Carpinus fangiana TaxID=176857 RepID=A0A5N6QYE4_9ROSI|nr:hypothetical protein FH972_008083 [Carpinus fangiana]
MASDNIAAKKKKSFTKVSQSKVRQLSSSIQWVITFRRKLWARMAVVQGRVVPDGKNILDSGYMEIGGIEYVNLRNSLEKLQLDIGACLD